MTYTALHKLFKDVRIISPYVRSPGGKDFKITGQQKFKDIALFKTDLGRAASSNGALK